MERHTERPDDIAAYETALDILARLLGYGTNFLALEESKSTPDHRLIQEWRARLDDWATRRRDLEPDDTEGIIRILEQDAPVLRTATQGTAPGSMR